MSERLDKLDTEFKGYYKLVDLIDNEDTLEAEQEILEHDDSIAWLYSSIKGLVTLCSPASNLNNDSRKLASKKLAHLQKKITSLDTTISSFTRETEPCFLEEYGERVAHAKSELSNVREGLLPLDLDDTDKVVLLLEHLEEVLKCSLPLLQQLPLHPLCRQRCQASKVSSAKV